MVQSFYRLVDHLTARRTGRVIVAAMAGATRKTPTGSAWWRSRPAGRCARFCRSSPCASRGDAEGDLGGLHALHREGRTYPLLYNDDVLVPGVMEAFHVERALAERYMPLGCGEIEFDHYSFGSPNGSVNTLKILELAIRGGYDPIAHKYLSIPTTPLVECETYEQFCGELQDPAALLHLHAGKI